MRRGGITIIVCVKVSFYIVLSMIGEDITIIESLVYYNNCTVSIIKVYFYIKKLVIVEIFLYTY